MLRNEGRRRNPQRGAALVEFALVFPVLLLLCMGAADFGRLFFHAVTVVNAAGTAAVFGARDNIDAGNFEGMQQAAVEDAGDIQGVTAEGTQFCACPDGTAVDCKDILIISCPGYGKPRAYVETDTQQVFEVLGPYPGIPRTTVIGRKVYMRVE